MADFPRCRVASWKDVDAWADRLGEMIAAAGPSPDAIVGLTRGGWVASRLLADRLGVKRLLALQAQHWGVTATPSGRAELTDALTADVSGLRTLVVDDITDTGESLELAIRHVTERRPTVVESATLLHITHSKFRPTYFAEEIPRESWVWVVFPWNFWEDLRTLGQQARTEAGSLPAAERLLEEKTGWAPGETALRDALREAPAPKVKKRRG